MDKLEEVQLNILLDFYKSINNSINEFQERNWKIRNFGITIWLAIIAFSYKETDEISSLLSLIPICIFFFLELGNKVLENKFIEKKLQLELAIEQFFAGDIEKNLKNNLLRSNIETPKRSDYFNAIRQWRFFFYYISMIIISIILFILIKNHIIIKNTPHQNLFLII